eukprot:scaffold44370_cov82-Phaeocystis_antarctica.AAC.3
MCAIGEGGRDANIWRQPECGSRGVCTRQLVLDWCWRGHDVTPGRSQLLREGRRACNAVRVTLRTLLTRHPRTPDQASACNTHVMSI